MKQKQTSADTKTGLSFTTRLCGTAKGLWLIPVFNRPWITPCRWRVIRRECVEETGHLIMLLRLTRWLPIRLPFWSTGRV